MKFSFLLCTLIIMSFSAVISANTIEGKIFDETIIMNEERGSSPHFLFPLDSTLQSDTAYVPKKRKLKAVLLSILLGHFGVHRIYLGTKPNVPVAYSLTLGGGLGLLPLIDAIMIIKSDDLDSFSNNDRVIMWSKQKETTQP